MSAASRAAGLLMPCSRRLNTSRISRTWALYLAGVVDEVGRVAEVEVDEVEQVLRAPRLQLRALLLLKTCLRKSPLPGPLPLQPQPLRHLPRWDRRHRWPSPVRRLNLLAPMRMAASW